MDGPLRVTFSVGGMTCASCSSTITRLLSEQEGVTDVSVNLIGNSASLVVKSKELITEVQEAIECAGFDASVASVEPLQVIPNATEVSQGQRTVALRIEGMFCERCPEKVMQGLDKMSQIIQAVPPTIQDPILRLTYEASPPVFTIRDIISAIMFSNTPQFSVTIHSSPSLEDRARLVQSRERRNLLYRLGLSFIIAVPTFIIGVVFMSLVSPKNPTRNYLMEPMWTRMGNASRIQWSLFFLATPVMFYSAGSFHKRSLKEIRALWRRGSRTPVWKRFLRFGSMNLLVSSGVSVAYFSSIVLLVLSASTSPSLDGHGDTSTYFDSVVFLTMFLLTGRYMEAYSKSRTGDAITSLAKLKPAEALVVGLSDKKHLNTCFSSVDEDIELGRMETEIEEYTSKPGTRVQKVPVEFLEIGDVVRVPSGSTPPRDSIVVSGHSLFDESSVTGESKPIKKNPGDHVFLGTINIGQPIDVRIDVAEGKTMSVPSFSSEGDIHNYVGYRAFCGHLDGLLRSRRHTTCHPYMDHMAQSRIEWRTSTQLSGSRRRGLADVVPRIRYRCLYCCMSMRYWSRSPNGSSRWHWYGSEVRNLGSGRGRGLPGGCTARRCRL